jgi:hypothetical protein
MRAGRAIWVAISARCRFIASVSHRGIRARRLCRPWGRSQQRCMRRRSAGLSGRSGACRAWPPAPSDLVLLADAGLVGEPDFYRRSWPQMAALCASLSRGGCPGDLRLSRPSGPRALNLSARSRTICSVTSPIPLGAGRPIMDRRQSQETPSLRSVLGLLRPARSADASKINPKRNGHDKPPWFVT